MRNESKYFMAKNDYDAIVIGSGPNGLAAAITLQRNGQSVLLIEGGETIGGGLRTKELTLPGYLHDVCSAVHPMAMASPFFQSIPFKELGVEFLYPKIDAAHPFDDGTAATLVRSIEQTAASLGIDHNAYSSLMNPLVQNWTKFSADILGPLHIPKSPVAMAKFGLLALQPSTLLAKKFKGHLAKGLWAGMAAHSIQPLSNIATSAIGLVLLSTAHIYGWPIPKGGSVRIADALASYFKSLGGKIETGNYVKDLNRLPTSKAILLDITPKQLLEITNIKLSNFYRKQLSKFRYGMGVFKMDWALSGAIPFTNPECRKAGTVHLGGQFEDIVYGEKQAAGGATPSRPFVLLSQPGILDPTRAPNGHHTVWAYCHVYNGSTTNQVDNIESQIERFAPGFKQLILKRSLMNTTDLQAYNPNYIGGDINGGIIDIRQLYTRPVISISPYRTSVKGIYLCSSSTPPGGGVHGMCGYHAANRCIKDIF